MKIIQKKSDTELMLEVLADFKYEPDATFTDIDVLARDGTGRSMFTQPAMAGEGMLCAPSNGPRGERNR